MRECGLAFRSVDYPGIAFTTTGLSLPQQPTRQRVLAERQPLNRIDVGSHSSPFLIHSEARPPLCRRDRPYPRNVRHQQFTQAHQPRMGVGPGQSQGQGPLGAVNEFKHNHPRRFVAILVACIVVPLVLLGGSHRGAPFLPSRAYAYPPEVYGTGALAIAPVSPSKAAARSEALWKHNLEKRKDFIREKGGLDRMRMFTEKKEGGWGQLYTVWVSYDGVPRPPCIVLKSTEC